MLFFLDRIEPHNGLKRAESKCGDVIKYFPEKSVRIPGNRKAWEGIRESEMCQVGVQIANRRILSVVASSRMYHRTFPQPLQDERTVIMICNN
jgi:hypothetical protein